MQPVLPYAQVSWLTNEMHLALSFIVLVTLIVWQAVRGRPLIWRTPIELLVLVLIESKPDSIGRYTTHVASGRK